jgi:hypothetical protein
MRNLRDDAGKLLEDSGAMLPADILGAARRYAKTENLLWWETLFLFDELERLTGVSLGQSRFLGSGLRATVRRPPDYPVATSLR